jgi:hypothetical protein
MAAWASELAPLRSPGFFAALKGLAGALRQVAAMHDQGRAPGPALLPLLEPILADRYDLLWRADRDIWRPRLFLFRGKLRLVLEFRHTILRVAWQEDAADGEGRSFAYDSAGVTPGPDGRDMLAEAARLHAKAVAGACGGSNGFAS